MTKEQKKEKEYKNLVETLKEKLLELYYEKDEKEIIDNTFVVNYICKELKERLNKGEEN